MPRSKPIKIVTLDTETYNGLLGDLKRIAIYDGKELIYDYTFESIEKHLIKWSKKYKVEIYIHNLEFDARKLDNLFNKGKVNWSKSLVINNKLATIDTKYYKIHDSFKILPMSLKKLSKDFEVEHGKLDLWEEVQKVYPNQYKDVVDFLDRCDKDDELYLKYLGYDVKSLYEVIQKLMVVSGLSEKEFVKIVSTASLSRYLFKNGYKGKQFKNPLNTKTDYEIMCQHNWKDDLDLEEFFRSAYCGGRTEVFKIIGEEPLNHYDVNSEYPFVMEEKEYPVGKCEYIKTPNRAKSKFEDWQKNRIGLGFIHTEIFIPKQHIPPLPVKMGKLVFPCGNVFGVWTFTELQFAIEHCGVEVKEVFSVAYFRNTYAVFRNFVNEFKKIKEQATLDGNESLRTFAKLILNTGYGYTGMTREKTGLDDIANLHKYSLSDVKFISEELGYIEVESHIKSEYIQVQIASYVTSFARLVLLQALLYCDKEGEVYYCDTDSVVTSATLPKEMVHPTRLGAWDLESTPEKSIFLRPKVYAEMYPSKTNIKFKGVSKETQSFLSFYDYEFIYQKLVEDKDDSVLVEKNRTMLRSIMYLQKNDIDMSNYEIRDKKMNLKTVEKRLMYYSENRTEPHYFETLDDFKIFQFKKPKTFVNF